MLSPTLYTEPSDYFNTAQELSTSYSYNELQEPEAETETERDVDRKTYKSTKGVNSDIDDDAAHTDKSLGTVSSDSNPQHTASLATPHLKNTAYSEVST